MNTGEVIELAQQKPMMNVEMKCDNCACGFLFRGLVCAQIDDLAECPECHSTEVRFA